MVIKIDSRPGANFRSIEPLQGIFLAVIFEPGEKGLFLMRPSVNYFKTSLKSLVIMLLTAPWFKLSSYQKMGLTPVGGGVLLFLCRLFGRSVFCFVILTKRIGYKETFSYKCQTKPVHLVFIFYFCVHVFLYCTVRRSKRFADNLQVESLTQSHIIFRI